MNICYIYQYECSFFQKKKTEAKIAKKKKTNLVKRKSKQLKNRVHKPIRKGIVYIGHIPHGFYEEQMKKYFKQFGKVTRVRVARSKRVCINLNEL